eukprot:SAG31_NODE_12218_length_958_cov_0.955763_2_plen_111_part_00
MVSRRLQEGQLVATKSQTVFLTDGCRSAGAYGQLAQNVRQPSDEGQGHLRVDRAGALIDLYQHDATPQPQREAEKHSGRYIPTSPHSCTYRMLCVLSEQSENGDNGLRVH